MGRRVGLRLNLRRRWAERRSRAALAKPPDGDAQNTGLVGEVLADAGTGEDDHSDRHHL